MWEKTRDTLVVVEPGTPAGYARIIALRAQLIGLGAHVAAPCPHDGQCPLVAPDWCHFTQRLPRSRAHKQLKSAELPYEDEKFAYVALTRASAPRHPARVLAQPVVSKVEVTAKLCTAGGLVIARVPRRAKADYAAARRWRWGDAVVEEADLGRMGSRLPGRDGGPFFCPDGALYEAAGRAPYLCMGLFCDFL